MPRDIVREMCEDLLKLVKKKESTSVNIDDEEAKPPKANSEAPIRNNKKRDGSV
jgi:hypothetical protein